jgi:hypothetical protein
MTQSGQLGMPPGWRGAGLPENRVPHQWFSRGVRASRVLPTIWVHRWTVSRVACHCSRGRLGQCDDPVIR